jgi:hypothetical protein
LALQTQPETLAIYFISPPNIHLGRFISYFSSLDCHSLNELRNISNQKRLFAKDR